jgi:hypothetical protein
MIDTSSKSPQLSKTKSKVKTEEEVKRSHCTHGPNGKCVNCLGVTKESMKDVKEKCTHGPNEKCINCLGGLDAQQFKHESFEHFLSEMKAKCKGKHKPD